MANAKPPAIPAIQQLPLASAVLEATLGEIDDLNDAIATYDEQVKDAKARRRFLNDMLVELVNEEQLNVMGARLSDGRIVSFKRDVHVAIPKDARPAAHQWLEANGAVELLRPTITVMIPKGAVELARALITLVTALFKAVPGAEVDLKTDVNATSLKAWARRRLAAGEHVPDDLFGLYAPLSVVTEAEADAASDDDAGDIQ